MESRTRDVDRIFDQWDRPDSPGCALAVIEGGEGVYARGYGWANLEYAIPITPNTVFHVASVSKQFTAMAIALLAREGKLQLDDDARQYLPELPDFGATITIRHLIHHLSGLRDQWYLLICAGWRMEDVITTGDVLDVVGLQRELNYPPGNEYLYSNTGYTLLALIVERLSGQSFRSFCAERIFQPLGMRSTHFHDDHREIVLNRAYSYAPKDGGGFLHLVLSYATVGASSLFTTVEDLARWNRNFDEGTVGGNETIALLHTQGALNDGKTIHYAFGLEHGTYRGLATVGHSGGDAGFRSYFLRIPERRFAVALLGNVATLNTGELARRVADAWLGDALGPVEKPTARAPGDTDNPKVEAPPRTGPELAAYAGRYYCPELDVTYTVGLEGADLVLRRRRYDPTPLVPASGESFTCESWGPPASWGAPAFALAFTRDSQNAIAGFLLGAGRIRHLRFVRQAQ